MQSRWLLEALQPDLTLIDEGKALAGDQLPYHIRDQNLIRLRVCAGAGRYLHGRPKQIATIRDGLTRIDT